jgi:large subunit ribosomal protein L22
MGQSGYSGGRLELSGLSRNQLVQRCEQLGVDAEGTLEELRDRLREEYATRVARAVGKELHISPKAGVELCRELRGMTVERALEYLDEVTNGVRAVPYKRYKRTVSPKRGMGPARYPVKAAAAIAKVIQEAHANADSSLRGGTGIDEDELIIAAAACHRGRTEKSYRPRARGRTTPFFRETANIEIILEAMEEEV